MLTAMGDVMREAYRRGWITTRDGNVSVCDPQRGICGYHVWKTDHNLTCWRNLEAGLKKRIDNKMNEILLEE